MDENHPLTKKELKAFRRLEKLDYAHEEKRQNTIKWIIIGIGSILFLAFFGFLVFLAKQNQSQPVSLKNDGWVKGSRDTKLSLVEFADFQCPACKVYHPIVRDVLASYDGKVKFIFKHFPLLTHKNAMLAAKAAEAAGAQEKFFGMHDLLYDHQTEWSELAAWEAKDKFISFAKTLELNVDQFKQDLDRRDLEDKIKSQQNEGINNGVNATPTFFVNGRKIQNPQGIEEFKKIIDGELR